MKMQRYVDVMEDTVEDAGGDNEKMLLFFPDFEKIAHGFP